MRTWGRAPAALPLLLGACQWVDEEAGRLDFDRDGIHVREDCNDHRSEVSFLEPVDGMLTCGDVVDGDVAEGVDAFEVVNCLHPFSDGDLARVGWREHVYGFVAPTGADVVVDLDTQAMLVADADEENAGEVGLLAVRGRRCRIDACELGLPLLPDQWRGPSGDGVSVDDREPWNPQVSFYAGPNELWHVIVSGGEPGSPPPASPFQLRVGCVSDG